MWMKMVLLILLGAVAYIATPAFGEYYRYRDEGGVLRFTDDLAAIPLDQPHTRPLVPAAPRFKNRGYPLLPAQVK